MRSPDQSRAGILAAAGRLLRKRGTGIPTLAAVAREARCAKGLVNYHFSSKASLLASVAEELGRNRVERWQVAFGDRTANGAIQATWEVILTERREGATIAWAALRAETDTLTVRTVNGADAAFGNALTLHVAKLLAEMNLQPSVPAAELGWYLAAVVQGMQLLLEAGAEPAVLQGAYSAAWLGILSLAKPGA
ncbi:MAG: hypothetical protein A2W29_04445 [Gemmatimonadetes bacterium RBG_16_66_8]|nr:MAG: hypothetical protein A2W29_04445 [Gemmatimonadetes bacterium RBG_16_66_8]